MLKEIDGEYRNNLINFGKYFNIMFAMLKIIEMSQVEGNKVDLTKDLQNYINMI